MFDIYLDVRFDSGTVTEKTSFMKDRFYDDVRAKEYTLQLEKAYVCYLEREETDQNYARFNDDQHYFVFGSVYSNNAYRDATGDKPRKLSAQEIIRLHHQQKSDLVKYIKGSFVIVVLDIENNETEIITDRMNVLPLYYCFKDNHLIVSSSVSKIVNSGLPSKTVNPQAMLEQLVFDYLLDDKTFFEDIFAAPPATILTFTEDNKAVHQYWRVEELYRETLLPRAESLDKLAEQLKENVKLYTSDTEKLLVAFTGGYDGRTNVAMLDKPESDYLCFSFGMRQSKQITIPESICKAMGITYTPIPLGEDFEQQYEAMSKEVIEFSNGTAPIIRANYPYAFKKLRDYSDTVLTGLFGSEILRPIHNLGIMMNDNSEKIFLSEDHKTAFYEVMEDLKKKNYIKADIIDQCKDQLFKDVEERFIKKYEKYGNVTGMFFFLLEEGVRKYFMQELQHERPYITNRFPYFDDDLVDLIYQTPFAGIYNGFLGKSKVKRRNAQLLYAHILKKYKPELGKHVVDRGYCPNDMLKPTPINYIYLLLGVIKTKLYNRKHGDDAFKSEEWAKGTIKNTLAEKVDKRGIFDDGLEAAYRDGSFANDLLTYTHMITLVRFFDGLA